MDEKQVITPEQAAQVLAEQREQKMRSAQTALTDLCTSHGVQLVGVPQYVPDGQGGFKLRVDIAIVPAQ